jgi:hypothetical protein
MDDPPLLEVSYVSGEVDELSIDGVCYSSKTFLHLTSAVPYKLIAGFLGLFRKTGEQVLECKAHVFVGGSADESEVEEELLIVPLVTDTRLEARLKARQ